MSDLDRRAAGALRRALGPTLGLGWWLVGFTLMNLVRGVLIVGVAVSPAALLGAVAVVPPWAVVPTVAGVLFAGWPLAWLLAHWLHDHVGRGLARIFGEV